MTDAYEHDYYHGKPLDKAMIAALKCMEADLGYELSIAQGIGGAAASAGTHTKGRAADLAPYDYKRKLRVGLKYGLLGWHRPYVRGLWPEHIHLVLVLWSWDNAKGIADSAFRQIGYYSRRLDGLVSGRFDSSTRPDLLVPFAYPPPEPPVPVFTNDITKLRDKLTEIIQELGEAATMAETAGGKKPRKFVRTQGVPIRTARRMVIGVRAVLPKR